MSFNRSGYIGRAPGDSAVTIAKQYFQPTSVGKTFTFSSGYDPGLIDVYRNGVKLINVLDYAATDGSTIVLDTPVGVGSTVQVVAYKAFNIATVKATELDTTVTGNTINLDGNITATNATISALTTTQDLNVSAAATANVALHVGSALTANAAGDVETIGIITAASFSGDGTGLSGVVGVGTLNVRTESLTVSGVSTLTGVTNFSAAVNVDATTDSTSSSTGALIVDGGLGVAKNVYIGAGLSVAGTLTYEDVTNVDSVGMVTAKSGLNVSGGEVTVGSGLTVASTSGVATFADGGSASSNALHFGSGGDLTIHHDGSNTFIDNNTGYMNIKSTSGTLYLDGSNINLRSGDGGETYAVCNDDGAVEINYNNSKKWETTNDGTVTTGIGTFTVGLVASNAGSSNMDLKLGSGSTWGIRSRPTSGENAYGFEIYKGGAGTDRKLTITSDGEILQGISTSRGNFGNNASGVDYIRQIEGTGATGASISLVRNSADANDGGIIIGKTRSATVLGNTVVQAGDDLGTITWAGSDGTSLQFGAEITATVETGVGNDDMPASLIFKTNSGTTSTSERLKINSRGGFQFNNAELVERVKITAGKLSDNTDIDLTDGMVHYFTTQETTTCTPNITISGSTLNAAMDAGDVVTVTLITTAAAAGYSANVAIDSNGVTEEWVGGSAPSEGGSDGLDIYVYTIICTHATNTGDSGFKVIANLTNATN